MATIKTEISSDFKKIFVKSDSASTNTDYPVLLAYIDNVLTYTFTVGGVPVVIDGVTYTPSTGVEPLDYANTLTILGTEYIFEINTDTLGLTDPGDDYEVLKSGVWKFKLLDNLGLTNLLTGTLNHYEIDCCINEKLSNGLDENHDCRIQDVVAGIGKLNAMLAGVKASVSVKEYTDAEQAYKMLKLSCESDDCGCGCD